MHPIDVREGYSQSYHESKQQRVANIDHRICMLKLCKSAKLTFFANFAYLSKIAISNLMPMVSDPGQRDCSQA